MPGGRDLAVHVFARLGRLVRVLAALACPARLAPFVGVPIGRAAVFHGIHAHRPHHVAQFGGDRHMGIAQVGTQQLALLERFAHLLVVVVQAFGLPCRRFAFGAVVVQVVDDDAHGVADDATGVCMSGQ
ncbi:hypothetical protein SDC9_91579 [bioreactor metagenome]|uniref:Uncharacterized protein n=1 Tax=bioreactor metagenome TaxID=1076179 RepID=A0A644ZVW4_9ZZZZ